MTTFLLIHGAWHGGWCWEKVVPLLVAKGHRVLAPDLPGMGGDRTPFAEDVLEQWLGSVTALIEAERDPVVLVGHSGGTMTIGLAAERRPDRVARTIYLAGFIPQDGKSISETQAASDEVYAAIRPSADGKLADIDRDRAAELFYNHMPPEAARLAAAKLVPDPFQPWTVPLRFSAERFGRVPRDYIETEHDLAFPLRYQRDTQTALPCERRVTLPSDHSPFYSMPEALAGVLDRLAGSETHEESPLR